MDTTTRALLLSWGWRFELIAVLLLLGALYVRGWWRLRQKGHHLAVGWRLVCYVAGLLVVALALMSPIDLLGEQLFLMHMIQHLLLIMLVPPLLWLGQPFPLGIWGMPAFARRLTITAFSQKSPFRNLLVKLASPGVVWFIFVALLWGWHDPSVYNAALRNELVHDLEHFSFFGIGMLYWWLLTGAAPVFTRRLTAGSRMILAVAAVPPNMFAGIFIAFSNTVIYTHYLSVPRLFHISALTDQRAGGLIMWIPGSMMFILAALIFLRLLLQNNGEQDRHKPVSNLSAVNTTAVT